MKALYIHGVPSEVEALRRLAREQVPDLDLESASTLRLARERLAGQARFDAVLLDRSLAHEGVVDLLPLLVQQGLTLVLVDPQAPDPVLQHPAAVMLAPSDGPRLLRALSHIQTPALRVAEGAAPATEEGRFQALVETTSDWIWEVDSGAVYTYASPRVEPLLGYRPEEVVGRTPFDLMPPAEAERVRALFEAIAAERRPFSGLVNVNLHRDGHEVVLETSGVPVFDLRGEWCGYRGVDRDISDRIRAEAALRASEDRYRTLVETARDVIFSLSAEGTLRTLNRAFEDFTGRSRQEWIGQSFLPLIHADDRPAALELFRQALSGRTPPSFELRVLTRNGDCLDLEFTATPDWSDGRVAGVMGIGRDITARKRAEQALRRREQALELAAEAALELLLRTDLPGAIQTVLERLGQGTDVDRVYIFEGRREPHSGRLLVSMIYEWVRPGVRAFIDDPAMHDLSLEEHLSSWLAPLRAGRSIRGHVRDFPAAERRVLEAQDILSILVVPIVLQDGSWGLLGFDSVRAHRDWSSAEESVLRIAGASLGAAIERGRAEESLQRAAMVFENTRDGVIITDAEANIIAVNRAFTEITGYAESEVRGRNPRMLHSGRQDRDFYQNLWASLLQTGQWQGEIWNRRKNGEIYPEWLALSAVRSPAGETTHYVGVFTDISKLKQSEEQIQHLAHYDALTGLPNRLLAQARLQQALDHAQRGSYRLGVLHIDLDRFKTVNESLGHPVGDQLLLDVTRRLAARIRKGDTLARLGGDEFVLVVERMDKPQQAAVVAEGILHTLEPPFTLPGGQEVYMTASIGISIFPEDGRSVRDLLSNADAALHKGKDLGRNTYHFYTEALTREARRRLELEARLRRALERREFLLHYQPLVAVASGRVVGAEALVRWRDPDQGLIPPAEFIPVAEDSGLIAPLGDWVLAEACRQMQAWVAAGLALHTIAVNLSTRQLVLQDVAERVQAALAASGLEARYLELEITESALMMQGERALATLQALKGLGVRLAVDDFGTGYSSLAYLKRFPIDNLKIDRSFVQDIPMDPNGVEIAATIIAMGRHLKLQVLAEGVETEAQLAFLREQGCDSFQGYLVSPPLAGPEFERWLSHRSSV